MVSITSPSPNLYFLLKFKHLWKSKYILLFSICWVLYSCFVDLERLSHLTFWEFSGRGLAQLGVHSCTWRSFLRCPFCFYETLFCCSKESRYAADTRLGSSNCRKKKIGAPFSGFGATARQNVSPSKRNLFRIFFYTLLSSPATDGRRPKMSTFRWLFRIALDSRWAATMRTLRIIKILGRHPGRFICKNLRLESNVYTSLFEPTGKRPFHFVDRQIYVRKKVLAFFSFKSKMHAKISDSWIYSNFPQIFLYLNDNDSSCRCSNLKTYNIFASFTEEKTSSFCWSC